MLNTTEQKKLLDKYGEDIEDIGTQVFHEFRVPGGKHGHGYPVVSPEDVIQAVFLKLVETDMGADALDGLNEPRGWLRTTARQYAMAEAEKRRRAVQADYSGGDDPTWAWVTEDPDYASDLGVPHRLPEEMEWEATEARVEEAVEDILCAIDHDERQSLFRLYYVEGLDQTEVAQALGRNIGWVYKYMSVTKKALGDEAARSLEVYRHWNFPDLYKYREDETQPTALLEALGEGTHS